MGKLDGLKPEGLFYWFEKLSSVPHGSGNTGPVADICENFAKERGLEYYRDALNNVIIIKEASEGYENSAPVILQGHLDMVCAKADGCPKDMAKEPIDIETDGEWVFAKDTSLGGDNIVAVAAALALLDGGAAEHPRLECVFTVDEETGMFGAEALDVSPLKGKMMINLDSEDEGVFTVSCAGGVRADCAIEGKTVNAEGREGICLTVSGLMGGHSGVDMDKGRASSNRIAARLLYTLNRSFDVLLSGVKGGEFDNVIPKHTALKLAVRADELEAIEEKINIIINNICSEYAATDPDIGITVEKCPVTEAADRELTDRCAFALYTVPYHVQRMSPSIAGLIQTSLNMGTLEYVNGKLRFGFAVRSSVASEKEELIQRLTAVLEQVGGSVATSGDYPGWEYREDSRLRETALAAYKAQSGKDGIVTAIHAGLECGLFCDKIKGLDCISMGPELHDVHSVRERLNVASTERMYALVKDILRALA